MPHIGFRVDEDTHRLMKDYAARVGTTVTDLFKEHINTILSDQILAVDGDWQVRASELFKMRLSRLQYFLKTSKTPIEFFAHVSGFSDNVTVTSMSTDEQYVLNISLGNESYTVATSKSEMKVRAIRNLCVALEQRMLDSMNEEDEDGWS